MTKQVNISFKISLAAGSGDDTCDPTKLLSEKFLETSLGSYLEKSGIDFNWSNVCEFGAGFFTGFVNFVVNDDELTLLLIVHPNLKQAVQKLYKEKEISDGRSD